MDDPSLSAAKSQFRTAMLLLSKLEESVFIQDSAERAPFDFDTIKSKDELVQQVSRALQTKVLRLKAMLAVPESGRGSDRLDAIFQQINYMVGEYRERKVELDAGSLLESLQAYVKGLQLRGDDMLSKIKDRFVSQHSRDLVYLRDKLIGLQLFIKAKMNAAFQLTETIERSGRGPTREVAQLKKVINSVFSETETCVGLLTNQTPSNSSRPLIVLPAQERSFLELDSKESQEEEAIYLESRRQTEREDCLKQNEEMKQLLKAKEEQQTQVEDELQCQLKQAQALRAQRQQLRSRISQLQVLLQANRLSQCDLAQLAKQLQNLSAVKQAWQLQEQRLRQQNADLSSKLAVLSKSLKDYQTKYKEQKQKTRQKQSQLQEWLRCQPASQGGRQDSELAAQVRSLQGLCQVQKTKIKQLQAIIRQG